jgi:hypothetical protein
MTRPRTSLLLAVAGAALAAGAPAALAGTAFAAGTPAAAAATPFWEPPLPIHYGDTSPILQGPPQVVANAAGLAVAVADTGGGSGGALGPHSEVSVFTNGVFLDPYQLSGANVAYGPGDGAVATYASTRLLAAGVQRTASSAQAVFTFGRLTPNKASLDAPRPLGPANMHAGATALAVNAAGDAAMVYPVCRDAGCEHALVYLAVRRHGTSTISSTRLFDGDGPLPRVAAAVDARGDALAVWTTGAQVRARVRTLGGTLRATQVVGPTASGSGLAPSAALSTHRGELVGWFSQTVSEGDGGPGAAYVAQARDGSAFSGATKLADVPALGPGNEVGGAGVRVAFDPSGRRLALWTGYENDRFVVGSAELLGAANSGSATVTDPVVVSDPAIDTVLSDMQVTASGQQVVTVESGLRGSQPAVSNTTVQVALRGAAGVGPFVREPVSDGASYASGASSAVAGAGRVLTTWTVAGHDDFYSQRIGPLP